MKLASAKNNVLSGATKPFERNLKWLFRITAQSPRGT